MLLTGEPISAQEALLHGLVSRVVPDEELEEQTRQLARKIAAASPYVVALGKQAFYRQLEMPQEDAYAYTKEVMTLNALAADAQEGMCAFLEKRPPVWSEAESSAEQMILLPVSVARQSRREKGRKRHHGEEIGSPGNGCQSRDRV